MTDLIGKDFTAQETKGLTRRQITTGAVWAVPIVAIAAATPAMAASNPGSITWGSADENGSGGTLGYTAGSNALSGYQFAYYSITVSGGVATMPTLQAVFTVDSNFKNTVFATSSSGAALTVGQTLPGFSASSGFQWTVTAITANTVTVMSATGTVDEDTALLYTPRVYARGNGVSTGTATIAITLSGGGNGPVSGSNTVQVTNPS